MSTFAKMVDRYPVPSDKEKVSAFPIKISLRDGTEKWVDKPYLLPKSEPFTVIRTSVARNLKKLQHNQ